MYRKIYSHANSIRVMMMMMTVLFVLYSIKYPIKQNPPCCAKSYPYKTHVCTTNDTLPIFYSCCHKCKIYCSLKYKHHKRYW